MMAFLYKGLLPLFILLVVVGCLEVTYALPMEYSCKANSDLDTTCQKCAKVTKSNIVYPMCCENDENVFDWCVSYIAYGQHE